MGVQIASRLMTRVGATFMRSARILAAAAFKARVKIKHQIINGFVLRATGNRNVYIATVLDFPGFVLFAGATSLPQFNLIGLAVPVGIRDDFDPPGTSATFEVLDKSSYLYQPVASRIRQSSQESSTGWFPSIQQMDWFLGYGRMDLPLLRDFPSSAQWWIDDETYFNYQTVVALTGTITSPFSAARTLTIEDGQVSFGPLVPNYFLNNQYAIDENDLPSAWKLYPRRLVPVDQSGNTFNDRRYPGNTMPGFAIRPISTSSALEGVDMYCHAARTFRQYQTPWGDSGEMGFDRYGEQGMLIAIGEQDRAEFNPTTGESLFAETARIRVVEPTDIAQDYLHPDPEFLEPDLSGKPALPNFGTFHTPTPAQCGSSFAVFSAYTTFLNRGDPVDTDNPESGDAWSIVTALPSGQVISLRADWNAEDGEIETGVPGEFMQPWIVGAIHIPEEGEDPTAYCLVWEQTYARNTNTPIKGEWSIYSTSGGTPLRTVISGGAPMFSPLLKDGPTLLAVSSYDIESPMCSVYYAGDNKLVTSAIDYPPSDGARSVRCAVFDVQDMSVSLGGEIATSNDSLEKCHITVVQPFIAAVGQKEAVPAVLLATITRNVRANNGNGKTYISVDGGGNWREYITDAGGQGGAFYAGNKLWKFDINRGLDGRARA